MGRASDDQVSGPAGRWQELADRVLAGEPICSADGLAVLRCPDAELLELLAAAYRVRRRYFGNRVQLYFLINAKSGLCPEDCGYCSQSKNSTADIPRYNLLGPDQLTDGARLAAERGASTYCIVISARGPSEAEIEAITAVVPRIKQEYELKICVSLGLLTLDQARRLAESGVDRVNHNLNTSAEFYEEICSTHSFEDRLRTLRTVREAGMEICSGGIVGMGERHADVVAMALQLRELGAESIPINFLDPIPGTPLEGRRDLDPRYCLKVLCLFRLANPDREIRIAGGREMHLGSLQPMGLYAANSIFVGDYLTTKGQPPTADYRMIEDLGFEVVTVEKSAGKPSRQPPDPSRPVRGPRRGEPAVG